MKGKVSNIFISPAICLNGIDENLIIYIYIYKTSYTFNINGPSIISDLLILPTIDVGQSTRIYFSQYCFVLIPVPGKNVVIESRKLFNSKKIIELKERETSTRPEIMLRGI